MYVILLDYISDLAEIDAALDAHVRWLDQHYRSGLFLASGRREPRAGGVILARGERVDVEAAVAEDPFAVLGLARHTLMEFHPSKFGGALDVEEVRGALA